MVGMRECRVVVMIDLGDEQHGGSEPRRGEIFIAAPPQNCGKLRRSDIQR
jgi:hypothetical protein